jgi:Ca2+-binding RTX toxin-like protein
MRRTTSLTAAGLLGLALLAPTTWVGPASAAGETCRGEAATIVGVPGRDIVGTEGRDVIVTNRSQDVEALGGDDLICINGPDQRSGYRPVEIDAGAGDDVVDGTAAADWPMSGSLGPGADTLHGGAGSEHVDTGARSADYAHVDTDHDVVLGGGGADSFTSGQTGAPNTDVIDLGGGDDHLGYSGTATGGSTVTGGPGDDVLSVVTAAHALTVDNDLGRQTEDGLPTLTWTGLEGFTVWASHEDRIDLDLQGTGADESFTVYSERGVVRASMRGGRDTFTTSSTLLDGSVVDAGAHRDLFYAMDRDLDLDLDLEEQLLVTSDGASSSRADVEAFEDADLHGRTVSLTGDTGHNDLGVSACEGTVRGRDGRDSLRRAYDYWFETRPGCGERYRMNGGAGADRIKGHGGADRLVGGSGNDTLEGSNGADTLVGGPGRDRADGGQGRPDRCVAERTKRCER